MASVMRDTRDMPVWMERYRPAVLADCILPSFLQKAFDNIVKTKTIPNLLFIGKSGIGKTTVAGALCNQLNADMLFVNASMEGNIDTLRTKIQGFASSMSLEGKRKVVLLDEADNLNPTSTQPALRGFMEEFARTTTFILTCNYGNKILPAIHSRCSSYNFSIPKAERVKMLEAVDKRVRWILAQERIKCDPALLQDIVVKFFPDIRKILCTLQGSISEGAIDGQKALLSGDEELKRLVKLIREREFLKARHWIAEHADIEPHSVVRYLYDHIDKIVAPENMVQAILVLAESERAMGFVVNQDINLACMVGSLMPIAEQK